MTLTEFLLERIAEDEAVARAASADLAPNWWEKSEHARVYAGDWDWVVQGGEIEAGPNLRRDPLAHIARHDPARVLAECDAKVRIVEIHSEFTEYYPDGSGGVGCYACDHDRDYGFIPSGHCTTLCALALPYADHPDYLPEWKP